MLDNRSLLTKNKGPESAPALYSDCYDQSVLLADYGHLLIFAKQHLSDDHASHLDMIVNHLVGLIIATRLDDP